MLETHTYEDESHNEEFTEHKSNVISKNIYEPNVTKKSTSTFIDAIIGHKTDGLAV